MENHKKNEAGAIEIDMEIYNAVVSNLEKTAAEAKVKGDIRRFFSDPKKKNNLVKNIEAEESILVEDEAIVAAVKDVQMEHEDEEDITCKKARPAQEKLESEVQNLEIKISRLKETKALGDLVHSVASVTTHINTLEKQKKMQRRNLERRSKMLRPRSKQD